MPTLIIREPSQPRREEALSGDVSVGSAEGNRVRMEGDPNVAPHHVLVERRGEAYWLINLVFARRTTLGGEPVATERQLQDGDSICLGGTSFVEFYADGPPPEDEDEEAVAVLHAGAGSRRTDDKRSTNRGGGRSGGETPPPPVGLKWPYVALAAVCAVVLVGALGLLLAHFMGRDCNAAARIISPRSGNTLTKPVEILAEAKETRCIERVVYKLNNTEVGRAEAPPYRATLDPAAFRHLSGAGRLVLTATVEERGGRKQLQPGEVLLAFAAGDAAAPAPQVTPVAGPTVEALPPPVSATSVGVPEIQRMAAQLAGQITGRGGYVIDRKFAMLILARAEEFRRGGYTERVRPVRNIVNKAFTDQGESPLLGYVLAFSRSRFEARGAGGIWRLPPVAVRNYLAPDETEDALSNPQRSAEVAALYTKALVRSFAHGDFMYGVACFGQTRDEAGALRTELARVAPDDSVRRDFGEVIKSGILKPEQIRQMVDFFAAGVVAENPEDFGLTGETRFSDL